MLEGPCDVLLKQGDRLYNTINNIAISASALAISMAVIRNETPPETGHAGIGCLGRPDLFVKLPASMAAFRAAFQDRRPDFIHFEIAEGSGLMAPYDGKGFHQTYGFKGTNRAMFFPHFVDFIERYKDWIYNNISGDRYQLPSEMCFALVIRDAISHNGIDIWNKKESVTWGARTYSAKDNGRDPFLTNELALGDLVLLMIEVSILLNDAKCPVL